MYELKLAAKLAKMTLPDDSVISKSARSSKIISSKAEDGTPREVCWQEYVKALEPVHPRTATDAAKAKAAKAKAAKAKAAKAKAAKAGPKDKTPAEEKDPWGLMSGKVHKECGAMHAAPLECFYWNRLVVDEYTYLEARDVPTIHAIKARSSWVLSGTPPIDSFDDVKSIAAFLGVLPGLGGGDVLHLELFLHLRGGLGRVLSHDTWERTGRGRASGA